MVFQRRVGMLIAGILTQCLGISALVLIYVWFVKLSGGLGWDGGDKQFNIHPVTMVTGLVFCYGEALLVYRVFRSIPKVYVKFIHAFLLFGGLTSASVGIAAIFKLRNASGAPNLQTVHSWLGFATYIMFGLQFVAGFACFLLPVSPSWLRKKVLPFHQFFGGAILLLVAATCASGIAEHLAFSYTLNDDHSHSLEKIPKKTAIGNASALMIAAFAISVLFFVRWSPWKRPPDDISDQLIATNDLSDD